VTGWLTVAAEVTSWPMLAAELADGTAAALEVTAWPMVAADPDAAATVAAEVAGTVTMTTAGTGRPGTNRPGTA
jgi:hypothetical protein